MCVCPRQRAQALALSSRGLPLSDTVLNSTLRVARPSGALQPLSMVGDVDKFPCCGDGQPLLGAAATVLSLRAAAAAAAVFWAGWRIVAGGVNNHSRPLFASRQRRPQEAAAQ